MRDRVKYFDAMVTPVACSGAAHRKCTNKTCAGWILCFAGYYVPLLGHLVTWIRRCRGMKSFTIGMNELNF